jgi:hypothetical protein
MSLKMSSIDIEALIGSPMQYPIDFSTGDEYYERMNDEHADDEMSDDDNSIEYCEDSDDVYDIDKQIQDSIQDSIQELIEELNIEQNQEQNQEQNFNKFIDNLKFMSLNEQKIILYQPYQQYHSSGDHSIIQMEF